MGTFEGYVGIRLWDGQLVDDVVFSLLFVLFMCFALVFRTNYRLFLKMMRDVVYVKERQNLFEVTRGSEWLFRNFTNLTVRDITIQDAAFWTLHMAGCHHVRVQDIKILNDVRGANNDGIDPVLLV